MVFDRVFGKFDGVTGYITITRISDKL